MNKKLYAGFIGLFIALFSLISSAQDTIPVTKGWHHLDKATDGYMGISLNQAYDFLKSKKLKSTKIIVAVIDGGIDTLHEDLRPLLWKNRREISGNGKDGSGPISACSSA